MNSKRDTLLRHVVCLMFLGSYFFPGTPVAGQRIVNGVVRDGSSGETLPAANIQVEGAYLGTISNAEGEFSIELSELPAALLIRYIGYASQRLEVTENTPDFVSIELVPTVYLLGEIEVTDQDPAVSIMRKVIERKQAWRASLESYQAEAYNRFTLKNDTGIVSIIESFTETYWNPTDGTREVVKARRQTNNLDIDEFLPAAQFVANMYDDDLEIAGYHFIGVTHPDALNHYYFSLLGYRQIDDRLVYDISVEPRNRFKTAFAGRVSVLDDVFAMIEVELRPGEAFLFPPPVKDFTVTYEQQFSNFGGDAWLPVDFRSAIELNIGFNLLLAFPTIYIDQVSRISNYEVNAAAPPDTLFAEGQSVAVDSVSVAEARLLEREGVAVPLAKAEIEAYQTIDSTMTLAKAYKPSGAFARFVNIEDDQSDSQSSGRSGAGNKNGLLRRIDISPHARFDRVEGLYGELRVQESVVDFLRLRGAVGASSSLEGSSRFAYEVGGRLEPGKNDRMFLDVNYARYNDTQWPSSPFLRTFNGLVVLLGGRDYYDYFRNERLHADFGVELRRRLHLKLGILQERHTSLPKQTDYDLFANTGIQRLNFPVEAGTIRALQASVRFGDNDDSGGLTGRRSIRFDIEHSDPNLIASDFSFTSYAASLEWRFPTLFRRRLLPNTLDMKLVARTSRGWPPLQRLGTIDGQMGVYNRFGAFKTTDGIAVRGRRFAGLFWEHNFKTFVFELLGMDWFTRQAWNVIAFGGHAYAKENMAGLGEEIFVLDSDSWRHEVGVSLSGVFSLLRIDFAFRLDEPGFGIGLGTARIF